MAIAVANRYARALADVVAVKGDYRAVLGELEGFAAAYAASADLRELLETPAVPVADKIKVLGTIAQRLQASTVTANFLRVLVANYRMAMLTEFVAAFRRAANQRLGVVAVQITSAAELSAAERQALGERFRKLTEHQVELEFQLDPALLGGILARIGSTVYDGSVRGQLERIGRQLAGRS